MCRKTSIFYCRSSKNAITNKKKNELWEEITKAVNAVGPANRSIQEVKDKWKNLDKINPLLPPIWHFPLFWYMVIYDSEYEIKKNTKFYHGLN